MKTLFSLFFITITTILSAQTADEAAIKKIVEAETAAFMNRDYDTWTDQWAHSEKATRILTGSGTTHISWDTISYHMKKYMAKAPKDLSTSTTDNFNFNISGEHAYVTYHTTTTMPTKLKSGKGEFQNYKNYQTRNLVKVDGEWKIINLLVNPMRHIVKDDRVANFLRLASIMLIDLDRPEDAAKIPVLVAELFPDLPSGYWGQGWFALQQKDKAAAMKHLEKAMSTFDGEAPEGLKDLYEQAEALK